MSPEHKALLERLGGYSPYASGWIGLDFHDLRALLTLARRGASAGKMVEAAEHALALCYHGDFKNGVTDSTGTIDEGDVRAGEIIDALRDALSAYGAATKEESQ